MVLLNCLANQKYIWVINFNLTWKQINKEFCHKIWKDLISDLNSIDYLRKKGTTFQINVQLHLIFSDVLERSKRTIWTPEIVLINLIQIKKSVFSLVNFYAWVALELKEKPKSSQKYISINWCNIMYILVQKHFSLILGYDCPFIENMFEFCQHIAGASLTGEIFLKKFFESIYILYILFYSLAAHLINNNSFKYVINWFG